LDDGPVVDLLGVLDEPYGALQLLKPLVLRALEHLGRVVLVALVIARAAALQETGGTLGVVVRVRARVRVFLVVGRLLRLFGLRLLLLGVELFLLGAGAFAVAVSAREEA
jgi:hypothetical protein